MHSNHVNNIKKYWLIDMQTVDNFLDSLKSKHTKYQYAYHLDRFKKWHSNKDTIYPTGWSENQVRTQAIIDYLLEMRNEGLSHSYRNSALFDIKHYYVMQDIVLNWVKISKFLGEN